MILARSAVCAAGLCGHRWLSWSLGRHAEPTSHWFNLNVDNIEPVTNANEVERVRTALLDLCEPLHDVFYWAEALRCKRMPGLLDLSIYGWHATHTVRALAHYQLKQGELGAWSLSGHHARNGELWLDTRQLQGPSPPCPFRPAGAASGTEPRAVGELPKSPALALGLPTPLFGPTNDRLLVLWRIDQKSHHPSFRVVRPIGDWKWGDHAQTDLDFFLPATRSIQKHCNSTRVTRDLN